MLKFMRKYWLPALFAALFMIGEVSVDLIQPAMMERIVNEGILGVNNGGVSCLPSAGHLSPIRIS